MTDAFDLRRARYLIATTLEGALEQRWSRATGQQVAIADLITGREERNRKHLDAMIREYRDRPMGEHYRGYCDVLDLSPVEKVALTGRPVTDFAPADGALEPSMEIRA